MTTGEKAPANAANGLLANIISSVRRGALSSRGSIWRSSSRLLAGDSTGRGAREGKKKLWRHRLDKFKLLILNSPYAGDIDGCHPCRARRHRGSCRDGTASAGLCDERSNGGGPRRRGPRSAPQRARPGERRVRTIAAAG